MESCAIFGAQNLYFARADLPKSASFPDRFALEK
jgi:hypothetical protein